MAAKGMMSCEKDATSEDLSHGSVLIFHNQCCFILIPALQEPQN